MAHPSMHFTSLQIQQQGSFKENNEREDTHVCADIFVLLLVHTIATGNGPEMKEAAIIEVSN